MRDAQMAPKFKAGDRVKFIIYNKDKTMEKLEGHIKEDKPEMYGGVYYYQVYADIPVGVIVSYDVPGQERSKYGQTYTVVEEDIELFEEQ